MADRKNNPVKYGEVIAKCWEDEAYRKRFIEDPEWDRYEQSILHRLADNVKIDIRGQLVHMTVSKRFAE